MNATTSTKWDVKVLTGAGAGMLALAGIFLWRDLKVPQELLLTVAALLASAVAMTDVPRHRPLVGPILLLVTSLAGGLWYAATKAGMLLTGLGLLTLVSAVTVALAWRRPEAREDRVRAILLWYGLTASVLAASWAFYFHFFTLGFAADDLGRRLVLTLGWLATGVGLVLMGRARGEGVIRDAGFAFIAVALGKALLYDTTHLSGTLRIACLAGAGALMLGGAWLTSSRTPRSA